MGCSHSSRERAPLFGVDPHSCDAFRTAHHSEASAWLLERRKERSNGRAKALALESMREQCQKKRGLRSTRHADGGG